MKTASFAPHIKSIHKIQEFVAEFLSTHSTNPEKSASIELVIEEIVTNIIHYGFKEPSNGIIDIGLDLLDQEIIITICDNGVAFNPIESKDPDLTADLDEREIGGLGIFLVKQLARETHYSRKNDRNTLVLIL